MSEAYTGGCACGAIRYEISGEPIFMNDCQCRDCQRTSGTGHGSYLHWIGVALGGESAARLQEESSSCRSSHSVRHHGQKRLACGNQLFVDTVLREQFT